MKIKAIRFFSPEENSEKTEKVAEQPKPTGYISGTGKLVLPLKTLEQLGLDPETTKFKIGSQEGKRKLKSLYLIPTSSNEGGVFELIRSGRGYVIPLAIILKKGGIDFADNKYTFTISTFDYADGVDGYELDLSDSIVKPAYTGKPRGRKPKTAVENA